MRAHSATLDREICSLNPDGGEQLQGPAVQEGVAVFRRVRCAGGGRRGHPAAPLSAPRCVEAAHAKDGESDPPSAFASGQAVRSVPLGPVSATSKSASRLHPPSGRRPDLYLAKRERSSLGITLTAASQVRSGREPQGRLANCHVAVGSHFAPTSSSFYLGGDHSVSGPTSAPSDCVACWDASLRILESGGGPRSCPALRRIEPQDGPSGRDD